MFVGYGLTEASPNIAMTPVKGANKYGSVGRLVPASEVKIIDLKTGFIIVTSHPY